MDFFSEHKQKILTRYVLVAGNEPSLKIQTCEIHKTNCIEEITKEILGKYDWMAMIIKMSSCFDLWLVYNVYKSGYDCVNEYYEIYNKYEFLNNLCLLQQDQFEAYKLEDDIYYIQGEIVNNQTTLVNIGGFIVPINIDDCVCDKCGNTPKMTLIDEWVKDISKPRLLPLSKDKVCNRCLGMKEHSIFEEKLIN